MAVDDEERRLGAVVRARVARLRAEVERVERAGSSALFGRHLVAAAVRQPVDAPDRPVTASQAGLQEMARQRREWGPLAVDTSSLPFEDLVVSESKTCIDLLIFLPGMGMSAK